jgi:hypothetical protein
MIQESFRYTYRDERDCGAESDLPEDNILDVYTCSNGTANYIVIETKRWALDEESLEQLYKTLKLLLSNA